MADNENRTPEETPETNYIEIIENLKKSTVPREQYDKVMKDNKALANALMTSKPGSTDEGKHVATDEEVAALRKKLFKTNSGITNLEYVKTALELRTALMSRGEPDPFLPNSEEARKEFSEETAVEIAEGLASIVEYADGDAALFNSELKRCCK